MITRTYIESCIHISDVEIVTIDVMQIVASDVLSYTDIYKVIMSYLCNNRHFDLCIVIFNRALAKQSDVFATSGNIEVPQANLPVVLD